MCEIFNREYDISVIQKEQKLVELGKILVKEKENTMKPLIMKCLNDWIKTIHLKTKKFHSKNSFDKNSK